MAGNIMIAGNIVVGGFRKGRNPAGIVILEVTNSNTWPALAVLADTLRLAGQGALADRIEGMLKEARKWLS